MGYLEKTLADGEQVTYKARYHWSYTLGAWLLLVVGVVAGWALWMTLHEEFPEVEWVALGVVVLFALLFLRLLIDKWTTEVAVTNRRFVYKHGWISRTSHELPMNRIEEVGLDQSVMGRLFGYGKLRISGTGGDEPIVTPNLDDPLAFRKALQSETE